MLSRVHVCCPGYRRHPHIFRKCSPVCSQECCNGVCVAPERCQCYPDYVPNSDGFCVPTCPHGENCDVEWPWRFYFAHIKHDERLKVCDSEMTIRLALRYDYVVERLVLSLQLRVVWIPCFFLSISIQNVRLKSK